MKKTTTPSDANIEQAKQDYRKMLKNPITLRYHVESLYNKDQFWKLITTMVF